MTPATGEPTPAAGDAPAAPILAVENLEVVYGASLAVRGISFEVPANGAVALLGPNGAGKTSTIRAISGLLDVHHGAIREGEIRLDGRERPQHALATGSSRPGSRRCPRGRLVFAQLTVDENLRVGASRPAHARRSGHARAGLRALPAPARSARDSRPAGSPAVSSRWWRSGGR